MPRYLRFVLCFCVFPALFSATPAVASQVASASQSTLQEAPRNLVQLTLRGILLTPGGGLMEISSGFWRDGTEIRVDLSLHLAGGTSARDLATLLVARLRSAGAKLEYTGATSSNDSLAHIFLEHASLVRLRLGSGLSASITTTDAAPTSLRILVPIQTKDPANLSVCLTTFHPHTKLPGRLQLGLALEADADPSAICEKLFKDSLARGLVSDRPSADRWSPTRCTDGALITGCSMDLRSPNGDWGIEVRLAKLRDQ